MRGDNVRSRGGSDTPGDSMTVSSSPPLVVMAEAALACFVKLCKSLLTSCTSSLSLLFNAISLRATKSLLINSTHFCSSCSLFLKSCSSALRRCRRFDCATRPLSRFDCSIVRRLSSEMHREHQREGHRLRERLFLADLYLCSLLRTFLVDFVGRTCCLSAHLNK